MGGHRGFNGNDNKDSSDSANGLADFAAAESGKTSPNGAIRPSSGMRCESSRCKKCRPNLLHSCRAGASVRSRDGWIPSEQFYLGRWLPVFDPSLLGLEVAIIEGYNRGRNFKKNG